MKFKSLIVTENGGPEVLRAIENDLRDPSAKEVRIKVEAAAVCRPDITIRTGEALYSGTPFGKKVPFVPGYAIIGMVDACGQDVSEVEIGCQVGVLTVVGGYSEYLYWRSDRLIPVPDTIDPTEAVPLILNYIVAYQTMHRSAKVQEGEKVLIIGASGGIGTALLQLGKLSGLKMYGLASAQKHDIVREFGATPIDYRKQNFAEYIRRMEPQGLDTVFDGMMREDYIQKSLSILRQGGRLVSFGEPESFASLFRILFKMVTTNLKPNEKSFKLYGTSSYFLFDKQPYLDDWATLFELMGEEKINPVIAAKYPISEAAEANAHLESGQVIGNIVLTADQ
jgi:NADPH:quinone reductase-like Zn-dependent oxidoreductase